MEYNVTLISVLFLILLFIPGFFFKRFYFSGQFTRQFGNGSFAERFITSIFWGVAIQFVAYLLSRNFLGIDYNSIKDPLKKFYEDLYKNNFPDCSNFNLEKIGGYFLFANIIAIILGWLSHKLVRLFRIDILVPVFRFTNHWHYYFKGEVILSNGLFKRGKVISTEIDVITEDGNGGTKLYTGLLSDYTLSSEKGELETISLTNAQRWSNTGHQFTKIPGDCLVIPYSKALNLNLRYNIRVRNSGRFRNVLNTLGSLVAILSFVGIIIAIPYYRYSDIGLLKTILAIITGIVAWFFIVAIFTRSTPPKKTETIVTMVVFALLFLAILYKLV